MQAKLMKVIFFFMGMPDANARLCSLDACPPTADHQPGVGVRTQTRLPVCVRAWRSLSLLQLQESVVPEVILWCCTIL